MSPTPFQNKIFWAAITALSFVALGWVATLIGKLLLGAIAFLQPVLIPIVIAGILAYLLEPVVQWLENRRFSRALAVVSVFLTITAIGAGILIWIVPAASKQGQSFVNNLPQYSERAQTLVTQTMEWTLKLKKMPIFNRDEATNAAEDKIATYVTKMVDDSIAWLQQKAPDIVISIGDFLRRSIGGFLGVFGFLLSLILVPVFLFFFLKEGPAIGQNWSNYLPLRASPLKSEIVSLLNEINNYLINFFRGQLLVSIIDGTITAIALLIVGLDFALLIGMMVAILGLIPYAGVFISWIPAVLIAATQFGDWWHPLIVTIIFLAVNNLDGMIIAPKIVGDSVGLHPLTVIISVLAWSLILGGLLGALLAVPLTATLKVVLKRYFWDRPPIKIHETI